jgi:hypothetical protein
VASRAQIARLAQRIEDLAGRASMRQPTRVVHILQEKDRGETQEDAMAKYLALHPENVGATVILTVIV